MKIISLIIVMTIFVIIALYVYCRYRLRYTLFKDMVYISKYIRNNIAFSKNNISQIIDESLTNSSKNTERVISNRGGLLPWMYHARDINFVTQFISSIGKGDIGYEQENLLYYEKTFADMEDEARINLDKNGKMYLKLIIGVGIAICILMI